MDLAKLKRPARRYFLAVFRNHLDPTTLTVWPTRDGVPIGIQDKTRCGIVAQVIASHLASQDNQQLASMVWFLRNHLLPSIVANSCRTERFPL